MKTRPCLLDSSFIIDLLNEIADRQIGPARRWLARNPRRHMWISPVTLTEVLEGADEPDHVRGYLASYRWQGIHHQQAETAALLQRRVGQRMGENNAWQAAIAIQMKAVIVGHDPKAFARLGAFYEDHRAD